MNKQHRKTTLTPQQPFSAADLVHRGESLMVEFKSDRKCLSDRDLVDAIAAMANSEGGVLLLGVEDDGTVTGLHRTHADAEDGIPPLVENRTDPPIAVSVERVAVDGKDIAVIRVPKSLRLVGTTEGKYLRRRIGPDRRPQVVAVRPADIVSHQSSLGLLDPSALVLEGVSVSELDPLQRVRLRQFIDRYHGDSALASLPDAQLDAALGLCVETNGEAHPTVAGLLLLGTETLLRKHVPAHEAAFQVLQGTKVRVNEFSRKPILEIFERFEMLFRAQVVEDEMDIGMFRLPIPNWDETAWREAFVNALVHRDYSRLGTVIVQFNDNGLTISSPGGLVEGLTPETLLTAPPRSRNPLLADAVKRIGLAERTGRGIDRIYEGVLRNGRPAPDFSATNEATFSVTMAAVPADLSFVRMLQDRPDHGVGLKADALLEIVEEHQNVENGTPSTSPMNGGKRVNHDGSDGKRASYESKILKFIREHGFTTTRDTMRECGVPRLTAIRLQRFLCDRGLLTRTGAGNDTRYEMPR